MSCSYEKDGCLELTFPAVETAASAGIATLSACLAKQGLSASQAEDVKIALAEAINNVVEHAYAKVAPADIQVSCCLCDEYLEIAISDTGEPLPGLRVPDGIPAKIETSVQNLPEGGFGWFLIRQLTSHVRYERRNGANLLCLQFDLKKGR